MPLLEHRLDARTAWQFRFRRHPQLFAQTPLQVSDSHPTAFTPAGYAFSIWGVIYLFGCLFMLDQLRPSRHDWASATLGGKMAWNLAGNCLWIFAFGTSTRAGAHGVVRGRSVA